MPKHIVLQHSLLDPPPVAQHANRLLTRMKRVAQRTRRFLVNLRQAVVELVLLVLPNAPNLVQYHDCGQGQLAKLRRPVLPGALLRRHRAEANSRARPSCTAQFNAATAQSAMTNTV